MAKIPIGLPSVSGGVKMYEKGKGQPSQTEKTMQTKPYSCKTNCPKDWKYLYRGIDISRYYIKPPNEFVDYGPWLAAPRTPQLFESPKITTLFNSPPTFESGPMVVAP